MTSFWLVDSALGLLVVSSTCVQKEKGKGKSMAAYYSLPLPKVMHLILSNSQLQLVRRLGGR